MTGLARLPFPLEHNGIRTAGGRRLRAGQARESSTDHDEVITSHVGLDSRRFSFDSLEAIEEEGVN
jgi:hypothetical protein